MTLSIVLRNSQINSIPEKRAFLHKYLFISQKLTRTTQREQIFTHSQWEIISPVSSLKNLPFPIATEQKCSKKVPDSHRREFRVISFEI